jgi:uncharacterized protein (UPF0262 family)
MTEKPRNRLIGIGLGQGLGPGRSADAEHERRIATYDLLEENSFSLDGREEGPYRLELAAIDGRLVFDIRNEAGEPLIAIGLALSPFRRIIKDYFLMCESYHNAIRTASPSQIETIDMARRALHNEGSEILRERLLGKAAFDFDTGRRLFTLVSVLHWRG